MSTSPREISAESTARKSGSPIDSQDASKPTTDKPPTVVGTDESANPELSAEVAEGDRGDELVEALSNERQASASRTETDRLAQFEQRKAEAGFASLSEQEDKRNMTIGLRQGITAYDKFQKRIERQESRRDGGNQEAMEATLQHLTEATLSNLKHKVIAEKGRDNEQEKHEAAQTLFELSARSGREFVNQVPHRDDSYFTRSHVFDTERDAQYITLVRMGENHPGPILRQRDELPPRCTLGNPPYTLVEPIVSAPFPGKKGKASAKKSAAKNQKQPRTQEAKGKNKGESKAEVEPEEDPEHNPEGDSEEIQQVESRPTKGGSSEAGVASTTRPHLKLRANAHQPRAQSPASGEKGSQEGKAKGKRKAADDGEDAQGGSREPKKPRTEAPTDSTCPPPPRRSERQAKRREASVADSNSPDIGAGSKEPSRAPAKSKGKTKAKPKVGDKRKAIEIADDDDNDDQDYKTPKKAAPKRKTPKRRAGKTAKGDDSDEEEEEQPAAPKTKKKGKKTKSSDDTEEPSAPQSAQAPAQQPPEESHEESQQSVAPAAPAAPAPAATALGGKQPRPVVALRHDYNNWAKQAVRDQANARAVQSREPECRQRGTKDVIVARIRDWDDYTAQRRAVRDAWQAAHNYVDN